MKDILQIEQKRKHGAEAALQEFKDLEAKEVFRQQIDTYNIYKGIARMEETIQCLEERNEEN